MRKKIIYWTFLFLMGATQYIKAQPYYYYYKGSRSGEFWRFNLNNGTKELFHSDTVDPGGNVCWDPTQTWIFIDVSRGEHEDVFYGIDAIKANNPSIVHTYPTQPEHLNNFDRPTFSTFGSWWMGHTGRLLRMFDGIVYNPVRNQFYVSWKPSCLDTLPRWDSFLAFQKTATFDVSTFAQLDNLPVSPGYITSASSVSDDGNYLYVEKWGYQRAKAIGKYSLLTKQLIINKRISDIYVSGAYDVEDSKKGNFLIAFLYPRTQMEHKKFAVYNIDKDTVYAQIPFPLPTYEYLSSDGKYVIIEETPWITVKNKLGKNNYVDQHPGRISVFNGVTGQLIQKLTLPPDGKVLIFDNYPNMLYYYLPLEQRSINIDLSKCNKIVKPDTIYNK